MSCVCKYNYAVVYVYYMIDIYSRKYVRPFKCDQNNDFNVKMIVRKVSHKDFYVRVEPSLFDVCESQVERTNECTSKS